MPLIHFRFASLRWLAVLATGVSGGILAVWIFCSFLARPAILPAGPLLMGGLALVLLGACLFPAYCLWRQHYRQLASYLCYSGAVGSGLLLAVLFPRLSLWLFWYHPSRHGYRNIGVWPEVAEIIFLLLFVLLVAILFLLTVVVGSLIVHETLRRALGRFLPHDPGFSAPPSLLRRGARVLTARPELTVRYLPTLVILYLECGLFSFVQTEGEPPPQYSPWVLIGLPLAYVFTMFFLIGVAAPSPGSFRSRSMRALLTALALTIVLSLVFFFIVMQETLC